MSTSKSSTPMGQSALSQAIARSGHLQTIQPLLPPQREQSCKMASLPQHLQDAYQRKQTSPRSNAYSSAVAQAEEEYEAISQQQLPELPHHRSSSGTQPGGTFTETGPRQALMEGGNEGLAHEEQVAIMQSLDIGPRQSLIESLCCFVQHHCDIRQTHPKQVSIQVLKSGLCVALQVQKLEGALAVASASVEGTIQNVTYKDEKSGYTVLRVAALHTAGVPPEQRNSIVQRPSCAVKGALLALASLCDAATPRLSELLCRGCCGQ